MPANDPSDWESAVYGFHYLRRRPVLHLGCTQYICLHKHLLYEKFFGGTVHVLTELVNSHPPPGWPGERKERINKVRRELGYIFPWNLAERARGESVDFIRHLADNTKKAGDLCTQITREGRVADLEVSVDTALPIVIMSEMMPINEITALTWQHDLIAATREELVLGHGNVQPVQTLSIAQLENLDRLDVPEGAASLAAFLEERSRNPFARLSGEAALRQRLGRSRRLQRFEDATHQSFRELVPKLFQTQP